MKQRRQEDIVDECVERLLAGEPVDDVLRSQPERAGELLPLLRAADSLQRTPRGLSSQGRRADALADMLSALEQQSQAPQPAGRFAWLPSFSIRPLRRRALTGAAAVVLGAGVLAGVTAAGVGPFNSIFGGSTQPQTASATTTGSIVSVERDLLGIETAQGIRQILRSRITIVLKGEDEIPWSDLQVGQQVDVSGSVRDDGVIAAERVNIKPQEGPGPGVDDQATDDDHRGPNPGQPDNGNHGEGDDGKPGSSGPQAPGNANPGSDDHGGDGNSGNGEGSGPGGGKHKDD